MDVRLPDGTIIKNVPEGTTKSQIQQKLSGAGVAAPQKRDDFFQRLGEDFETRKGRVQELKAQGKPFLAGSKAVGQAAGLGLDVIGEGIESGLRVLPDFVEKPIRGAGRAVGKAIEPVAKPVMEKYGEFKEAFPSIASVVEDVTNVGMLLAPARGAKAPKQTIIGKAGESLKQKGFEQSRQFVDDLVLPKMSPTVEAERQASGLVSQSAIGGRKYSLDPLEKIAAEEIKGIKSVSKLNSLPKNERIVRAEAIKRSGDLVKTLEGANIPISRQESLQHLSNTAIKNITDNPMITAASGSSETANKLVRQFVDILNKSDETAAGLMKARQEFDKIAKQYRSGVFDASSDSAYTIATREIRNAVNDLVDAKAPNQSVRDQLRKSHSLFNASENMAEKVPSAAKSGIERIIQTIENKVPGKSELVKLLTVGGIAAPAAIFAPGVALTAAGLYAGGKALGSSVTKKALGNLLTVTDLAISKVKDGAVLEQLRADRALIQDYLSSLEQEEGNK